jgi:hypothetical protein
MTATKEDTMTEAGSDSPKRDDAEELVDELGDLDVPDGVDVSGGSTAFSIKATGEKQGTPKG